MGRNKLPPSERKQQITVFVKKKYHEQAKAEIEALARRYEFEELTKSKEEDGTRKLVR